MTSTLDLLLDVAPNDADLSRAPTDWQQPLRERKVDALQALAQRCPISAEAFLTLAAGVGLFSDEPATRDAQDSSRCRFSLPKLVRRDYVVRLAAQGDLTRLCELEKLCWQHTRSSRQKIRARLETYPLGQFVLEKAGKVLGVIYSQRIADVDALDSHTAASVSGLHQPSGSIIQLLAVNIDPSVQSFGYGDQLLEFMLQRCALVAGVDRVVGVTLCRDYHGEPSLEQYIRRDGENQDPILAFHSAHGASIVKLLPGYRPDDRANAGHGVLVSYDILRRVPRRRGAEASAATLNPLELAQFVQEKVRQRLGADAGEFHLDRPLMEMGLDSADLLKLQQQFEEKLAQKFPAGFFFEYNSVRKVVDYLTRAPFTAAGPAVPAAATSHAAADIAIVGLSCKLPGGIESPDALWQALSSGASLIDRIPEDRGPWPSAADMPGIDQGGFVRDVDAFDAGFFRMTRAETVITDPQQRMLLQLGWACLEDAGILPSTLRGTNTGVFIGASNCDYSRLVQEAGLEVQAHHGVGSSLAILANRLSYFFDFSGPSLNIDTACSSSLVALHTAIQSLRSGECAAALVGGVNLICHPDLSIAYHKAGMLAPDGRCKPFDASANGYVRSEGAVMLLLKPLASALADGDRIHAVIKGSAINHGGLAGGLTVPNPQKQSELLQAAWKNAGIAASDLSYIEAHGTGTSLGDPIEVQGIQVAFGREHAGAAKSCAIGSVKSNLGHLESAAGLAGLLKIVVCMQHRQLPPSIQFSHLNPKIRLDGTPLYVQQSLDTWSAGQPLLAAVSSFGSGGANAHVVLAEFPRAEIRTECDDAHLFVLSAMNEERLRAYAAQVSEWLDRSAGIGFADAIYTWQAGRTAMKQRLAIKATGFADLRDKLNRWLTGTPATVDCWSGEAGADAASGQQIAHALRDKDLEQLGTLWTKGLEVDWRSLHDARRACISLPTYPFARERFWIDMPAASAAGAAVLHPLLHANVSDLHQQVYQSNFGGEEFFLADHQVNLDNHGARPVLPAVAYLEMARVAIEKALPRHPESTVLELRDTLWSQPLLVDGRKQVRIELAETSANGNAQIEFEVRGENDNALHCEGRAAFIVEPAPARLDLDALRAQMQDAGRNTTDFYDSLARMGLVYGPAHRAVTALHQTTRQALAQLNLPDALRPSSGAYLLHPSLMDGALQAAVALVANSKSGKPSLPFALDSLRIFAAPGEGVFAWVRQVGEHGDSVRKMDIDLCDEHGNVCIQMRGFSVREAKGEPALLADKPGIQCIVPHWNPYFHDANARPRSGRVLLIASDAEVLPWLQRTHADAELLQLSPSATIEQVRDALAQKHFEHLVWVAPDVTDGQSLIEAQQGGVLAVFRIAKALLDLKFADHELAWTLITRRAQRVHKDEPIQPAHAGVFGLVGSLAKEYPQWNLHLMDVDSLESATAARCLSLPADKRGNGLACRQGEWLRQEFAEVQALPADRPVYYRQNGVYVVIGGAGGLGGVWSRFMIERFQARMVWIGREEINDTIRAKIDALGRLGPAPLYVSADATDLEALQRASAIIAQHFPAIHGVVHSAIILQDKSVQHMDEPRFRAGLSAKVDISVNLDRVFGAQPLDFMLFFSSVLSFIRSPGQSNYAAGCTFKDSFAASLRQARPYPVKVVNWGYWGKVGIVANDAHGKSMARLGFGSIDPEEGMSALQALIGSELDQVAIVKTVGRSIDDLVPTEKLVRLPAVASTDEFVAPVSQRRPTAGEGGLQSPVMDALLAELLAATLADAQFRSVPAHQRWLDSSIRFLEQRHLPAVRSLPALWSEWDSKKATWEANPNLRAQVRLVEACLKSLPDLLGGRARATDVMFPGSSMQLVEGIYRDNALADHFNEVLGDTLLACARQSSTERGIRILEIGAGTGGTTARILPALEGLAVAEYCYTDVSRAFLMHGEEHYQPLLPTLTTALFDASKPLASQDVEAGGFDFVIATNVLHATPRIREALRNAKALLKSHGVLLLNEISTWSLFTHLTFGLLEGWWLHEDAATRLPGSPGLTPDKWAQVLAEEGFDAIAFPAAQSHQFGQQVIAARSDGWVRQPQDAAQPAAPVASAEAIPASSSQKADSESALREAGADYFRKLIAATLRIKPEEIELRRALGEYGLDSILIGQLNYQLRKVFPGISSTLFFEVQTIAALVDYFLVNRKAQLQAVLPATTETEAVVASPPRAPALERGRSKEVAAGSIVDVAIVGLSGRYPKAKDLGEFWDRLSNGVNCITQVPAERWKWEDHFDAEKGKPGKIYSQWGGFLDGIDEFDPLFFKIAPKEAKRMDPQERLFLQSCYHAIEDAGYTPEGLGPVEKIGVFVGVMNSRYTPQPAHYSIANRVSYFFNFQGPSMAVDTACSSSLTAIHLALESLYSGMSDCVIAGGVNLIIDAVHYQELSELTMLSSGNECRAFGERADGFVDAEGVGAIVLKPLEKAERDGDHIYGVIKGSAINAGGKTNGYTVPNPIAQAALVTLALQRARVPADHVSYVEAHGTGTALGDPIEIAGLTRAFASAGDATQYCAIGSLKSNIGHCESAAGIAGLTKVLLQLKHGQLVPSLHSAVPNPGIDFAQTPFRVQQSLAPWARPRRAVDGVLREVPRIAGVSSFGAGGSNAHLIVEEYRPAPVEPRARVPALVIPLSARTPEQLRQKAQDLLDHVRAESLDLADVAYTLQTGREALEERFGLLVSSPAQLTEKLQAFIAREKDIADTCQGRVKRNKESSFTATGLPLAELLGLWVQGAQVDWQELHVSPRRVSLPPYPFAKERYWIDRTPATAAATLHPLLHANTSDLGLQRYSSTFTGREFFFVDRTLPAMAQLEMARVAMEHASRSADSSGSDSGALELRDVHWARPVALRDAEPMHIALREHGDAVDFEIYSGQGETEIIRCQGRAAFSAQPAPAKIDLGELETRMTGARLDAGAMSAIGAHLIYGVSTGDRQLLAQLRLPESLATSLADYVLHPSLMEGAMQAASGLIEGWKSSKHAPGSPISLESVRVLWPCARDMVAWTRFATPDSSDDTYIRVDIDLCDAQGQVCVQMRGIRYAASPVRVTLAAPKPAAREERKKAIAVSLAAPVVASSAAPANTNAPSGRRPAVTLSNPLESTTPSGLSTSLSNLGTGIYELRADAATDQVLQAMATAAASDDVKVLIISGAVARASQELYQAIAAFPVPTIAAVEVDVSGGAFLACALCDFMVLSESANYSFSKGSEGRGPSAAEEALFAERLGFARAYDFLHVSTVSTGAELREKGWTCPITPRMDVETRARQLASDLSGKSQTALRLLKQHLSRPFNELVGNLAAPDAPVLELPPQPDSAGGNPVESTRCFSLSTPIDAADVLVVTIGDDDVWPRDLAHGLARTIARANASSNYKAIIFACECRDFLAYAPEGVYEEFRNLLLESRLPVIGALTSNARGLGWLASQFFDACVYCTDSGYSFDDTVAGLPVESEAAVMFPLRLGDCLGREIVLTGAEYSGADLRRRAGAAIAARDSVLTEALKIARQWTRRPREAVVAWKRRMTSLIRARSAAAPQWPEPQTRDESADAPAPLTPTPVRLESNVVSAVAHPDGILVVRMEDREAKNLFSDAFVAGVREVFAHIEQTPAYKAVVLTGYDSYFASGGTQETLLAIQEGRAKFTDFKIFQLPMECRVPVIAAMQGHGIGGGWSLGMFADLILMSEESRYVSPYMDYGFTPGAGSTLIFPRQIGHDLARESLLTAHSYTGAELRSRGVSLPVLARTEVLPTALSLARKIARAARRHLAGLKWQLTHASRAALIDTYERELAMHEQTFVGQSAVVEQIQGNFLQGGNDQVVASAPRIETRADHVSDDDALTAVKRDVRMLLAAELQMQENDVDEDVQFIDLGMDSIAAVTWVRKINEKYKLSMLATKVYSYPTLKQLSRFITDEARQRGTLPGKPAAAVTSVVRPVAPAPAPAPAPVTIGDPAAHRVLVSWRNGSAARAAARPETAIAVIGIAGQFPQARNVEEFWQNIAAGRSCVTEIPAQRWNIESYYRAGAAVPGKTNSRWMGALDDYDRFDPLFFSISPTEAENMDPQQRLFLEACWHAIENAGYDADALSGSKCGVFAGCANGDYQAISPDQRLSAQGFTGGANSILAARISYFLNLQGPCLSIDTACSSSLAALAAACDSLVSGGSDMALAGGVAVMATPEMHIKTAQAGMLSPDGRCFTFDQRANGFVPGEAVGVVMLKRLADAEKDGDLICGVIEGWGVNQDGKTNGITAPNPESQTRLQQETYDRHQIDPANIQLIEAHGTGTKLGDPIEVEGLKGSFAKYTQKKRFCALGSVKSDIGHCLAAAGIAGFIKLVLALRERQLPPTINFERLNEHIELDDSPFYVNDRLQEWTLNGADRRRAAISAFGFSGTNVHVVLAEHASAGEAIRHDVAATAPAAHLIPLSARTATQLKQKARDLLAFVRSATEANSEKIALSRLARTLQVGRTAMEERTGFVVSSLDELTARLQEYVDSAERADAGHAQRNREITRLLGEDSDLKEIIVDRWIAQQKLPKLLDLWIKGVALDWNRLHGDVKAARMRLPLYPFARERYWIDVPGTVETVTSQAAVLHPLLHTNTSDFRQQRYQSIFSGAEFFLNDHRVRLDGDVRKVLPGVAYLEMARAAMTLASAGIPESAVLELRNTVWLKPLVVAGNTSVSITLSASEEDEGDQFAFEICSGDAQIHCQGVATFTDAQAPARLELSRLEAQMTRGTLLPAKLYAAFEQMGLHYGPAHRAVVAVEAGENQLLARLRTPAFLASTRAAYLLHPALMDCALQASVSLITDIDRSPGEPIVPFAMDSLRICSPDVLTPDAGMYAWIRYTPGSRAGDEIVRLDIDVCDSRGFVGVAMRGFAVRVLGSTAAGFDEAFYQRMIERILNEEVSAADAAQMG